MSAPEYLLTCLVCNTTRDDSSTILAFIHEHVNCDKGDDQCPE